MNTGGQHNIRIEKGIVIKTPMSHCILTPSKAQQSVDFFAQKFGDIIPDTQVLQVGDSKYEIHQEYIEGDTLGTIAIEQLSVLQLQELLEFIETCFKILFFEGKYFDIIGFQPNNPFADKPGEPFLKRLLRHYTCVKNFFTTTNFVVQRGGKIFFVDNIANYGIYGENGGVNKLMLIYRCIILLGYRHQIQRALNKKFK